MGVEVQLCLEQRTPESLHAAGDHDPASLIWQYRDADDSLLVDLLRCSEPVPIYHVHLCRGLVHRVLTEFLHVVPSVVVHLVLHRIKLVNCTSSSKDFVAY